MHWTEVPIHFIDFEGSRSSGVLEYGVVTLAGGTVAEADTRLCGATGRIRQEDAAVHRITEERVAQAALFSDEFDRFCLFRQRGPLAAHFSGTENGLLKAVWPYPRSSPDFSRPGQKLAEWGPWIDSARLCAEAQPASASLQLQGLIHAWGLQAELDRLAEQHCPSDRRFYHAALYDALAGALLLLALLRLPNYTKATIPFLLQASVADARKRAGLKQDMLF